MSDRQGRPRGDARSAGSGAGRLRAAAAALLLAALAGAVFAGSARNGFILLDDKAYIYDNDQVLRGLGWETALWALRSTEDANWYPLRRLTHLADASLFGMWAGGHHLVSVAWHAAAAVLLYLALRLMTGRPGASLAVAALFAAHPLQVESVAWAAERSSVLAGFFFGLTLLLWARYARRPSPGRFGAATLALALGLAAKPSLMAVPLLLALLDCWPLGRYGAPGRAPWPPARAQAGRLLLEKAPLLGLAAAAGAVAVAAHRATGSLVGLETLPLWSRLGNAALSCWRYLGLLLWPRGLSVHYPHPGQGLSAGTAALAWLALAVVTAAALAQARRRPWLAAGWLWFLVMLVPTSGVVQFATQAMADRFAYLALAGCALAAVWTAAGTLPARGTAPVARVALAVAVVGALGAATVFQTALWRSSGKLFAHALASTPPSSLVLANLGVALLQERRVAEALPLLEQAVRLGPRDTSARNGLGHALSLSGRHAEAAGHFLAAVEADPASVEGRSNLATALIELGRHEEARQQLLRALGTAPGYAPAHVTLGNLAVRLGRPAEAVEHYQRALAARPSSITARFNLGMALLGAGRRGEAAAAFEEVLRRAPDHALARAMLGTAHGAAAGRSPGGRPGGAP